MSPFALILTALVVADPIVVTPMPVEPPAADPGLDAAVAPAAPAARPGGNRKLAIAANTAGLRFHRAGQFPRAAMRFRDATLLDPSYAMAHFNLACAASRLRDVATTVTELDWLAHSNDAVAAAKLEKSLVDPDIDFASALPRVRAILKLAPFDPTHPLAWLSERHGTWSAELPTDDCATRSYMLVFEPDGMAHLIVNEACSKRATVAQTYNGAATLASDGSLKVEIDKWPLWPSGVRLAFRPCPGLGDAPASCFVLINGDEEIGPFHRGLPGISPMRARADVAVAK